MFPSNEQLSISLHLLSALGAGALVGVERSYHGRPAGFRTHALVCLASSLLMTITVYQFEWVPAVARDSVRLDPTRMAQGIMTGIGFLGAGVIMKEGLSIRGLTTAASIWTTAAIGILFGVGFYFPAVMSTVLALAVLGAFRWIEWRMPTLYYAQLMVRFVRDGVMPEEDLRTLVASHGFSMANLSYRLIAEGTSFEYRMTIRGMDRANAQCLVHALSALPGLREFRISPSGD
jgi:putative Mg2+ transporter-C (MgtC) family protein